MVAGLGIIDNADRPQFVGFIAETKYKYRTVKKNAASVSDIVIIRMTWAGLVGMWSFGMREITPLERPPRFPKML